MSKLFYSFLLSILLLAASACAQNGIHSLSVTGGFRHTGFRDQRVTWFAETVSGAGFNVGHKVEGKRLLNKLSYNHSGFFRNFDDHYLHSSGLYVYRINVVNTLHYMVHRSDHFTIAPGIAAEYDLMEEIKFYEYWHSLISGNLSLYLKWTPGRRFRSEITIYTPFITFLNRHPWTWVHSPNKKDWYFPIGAKGTDVKLYNFRAISINSINAVRLNSHFSLRADLNFVYRKTLCERELRSYNLELNTGIEWHIRAKERNTGQW
ncbi:hypothetical protein QA601_14130 [Chitinispirillales bacterium ANBcel5]|uniref:hypothetical protein n=1 Tax=Cellulosispirillum alkaliphilum TaxID=3039283 RepID=UPI002A54C1DA|nr:hypothetical protein [Chitinispirillales bacterium ANBcel5]